MDAQRAEQTPWHGLTVTTTVMEGVQVLTLTGEVDHDTSPQLRSAAKEACAAGRPRIVADLSRVTFMDSSGLNILIAAHRDASEAGGWLRIAAPVPSVLRTLRLVGVDEVIPCSSTVQDALGP
ncbi:STAS domain-containing protein [Streptomyces sp. NPDC000983]|uniref:STAS domain-containing protein n=1 Tax=Streptomyces sp. NPDC000983 TaxID=3154373 RepID=UPI00332BC67D